MVYVGVDVGGTKVLAVETSETGAVLRSAHADTPGRAGPVAALEDALTRAVLEVADGRDLEGVGVSAAALVDPAGATVRFATHLPWREDPVRARLADRWGVPVVLDNDANCAAEAERVLGAGRGAGSFLLVTVGTGIGGAVVLGDRVWRGGGGMAGEFGHMPVVPEGLACPCGQRGCWEQYCSGRAVERAYRDAGGVAADGGAVTAAARSGDPAAVAALAGVGEWLGTGLAGLVAALDPALVVVGGGVSAAGDLLLGPARSTLAARLMAAEHRSVPELVRARFGPEAGAVGAALLARRGAAPPG